jgi:hypothetical protein
MWTLSGNSLSWYRTHGFRYAIASSLMYFRYVGTDGAAGKFYDSLFSLPTVYRAEPTANQQGPTIIIVDLGPVSPAG